MDADQILLAEQEQHNIEADNGISRCGRNPEYFCAVANPLRTLSLKGHLLWHKEAFFIDEPVPSRDDLDRTSRSAEVVANCGHPVHHVAMLPSCVKLSGRQSPRRKFGFPASKLGRIIEINLSEETGAIPDILVSCATANH